MACGLACASKPTAWFILPFYALYLARGVTEQRPIQWDRIVGRIVRQCWPVAAVFLGLMLPYLMWDPVAMWDDIWGWSSGLSAVPYQVRGWGLSTVLLALGVIPDRMAYFPFWLPEVIVCGPLLLWLLVRQFKENDLGRVCLGYGALLFAMLFLSRFLNENYLGYLVALLALGAFVENRQMPDGERRGDAEIAV